MGLFRVETYLCQTMEQLLTRGPENLHPSEDTIRYACMPNGRILELFLRHWPEAHIFDNSLRACSLCEDTFKIIIRERPSVTVPLEMTLEVCQGRAPAILGKIFAHQPDLPVTEEMLMESASSWAPAQLEVLFRHYPHSQVIEEVLLKAMDSVYSLAMLEVILDAKPRQVVTPVSLAIACGATEKAPECTTLTFKRFQVRNIGEDTMLQIVDKCWPNSLMTVLSQRPGAVVTKGVVARLIERLRQSDQNVRDEWRESDGEDAFSILLDRSDIPEDNYVEWKSDFHGAVSEWDMEISDRKVFKLF